MRKPFEGEYPITQVFGVNPADYAQYGLAGHNGIDYGLPCGTKLVSAISGVVKQVGFESGGYGNYIQIDNATESFVVAHLTQQSVKVGEHVDEGQVIGWSGTTGNSTGCHLHFGYFRFPRDRQNGFNGYIDPTPYFSGTIEPEPEIPTMNDQTKIAASLLTSPDFPVDQDLEIQQIRGTFGDYGRYLKSHPDNPPTPPTPPETPIGIPQTAGEAFSLAFKLAFAGKF